MDIKLIPATTTLLIDANILIYHLGDSSAECTDFLKRVALGEIEAYVTTTILAEVLHRRLISEALAKGLIPAGQPVKKLKANPLIITSLTDYLTDIEDILTFSLKVIEVTLADIIASHTLRQSYGLFVNDSINIACAQRFGISNIVTRDNDFSAVLGVNVWQPTDIVIKWRLKNNETFGFFTMFYAFDSQSGARGRGAKTAGAQACFNLSASAAGGA